MAGEKKEEKKWSEMTDEEKDALSDADALDKFYSEIAEEGK